MAKRIVACCDGTWNSPDQSDGDGGIAPTNITKLALSIAPRGDDGREQRVVCDKGVGTGRFETFEPGDELFLLGFSRGAFTARGTVGMIDAPRPLGARHDSRTGVYRYLRPFVRAFGTATGEQVASSAVHRFGALGREETPETFRSAPGGTITSEVATVGFQADDPVAAPGPRAAEPTKGAT